MALITSLIANFFNCFKVCVTAKGYTGRASRYEFWGFMAVSFLLVTLLELTSLANAALIPLLGIYHVLSFIPLIAVAIRRLHDINKSAWQLLLTPLLSLGIAIVVQLLSFLFKLFGVLGIIVMVFYRSFPLDKAHILAVHAGESLREQPRTGAGGKQQV